MMYRRNEQLDLSILVVFVIHPTCADVPVPRNSFQTATGMIQARASQTTNSPQCQLELLHLSRTAYATVTPRLFCSFQLADPSQDFQSTKRSPAICRWQRTLWQSSVDKQMWNVSASPPQHRSLCEAFWRIIDCTILVF